MISTISFHLIQDCCKHVFLAGVSMALCMQTMGQGSSAMHGPLTGAISEVNGIINVRISA